jgi:hypothetical protein
MKQQRILDNRFFRKIGHSGGRQAGYVLLYIIKSDFEKICIADILFLIFVFFLHIGLKLEKKFL